MARGWMTLGAILAVWMWPVMASACPVCFDPREENRLAFIVTTILLTFTPLLLLGGAVYWMWRRYKVVVEEMAREEEVAPT